MIRTRHDQPTDAAAKDLEDPGSSQSGGGGSGAYGKEGPVRCPDALSLSDGQLGRLSRALGADPGKLRRLERAVAVDYVNAYDGNPSDLRPERAWRGGLAKMLQRVWRNPEERRAYLAEPGPDDRAGFRGAGHRAAEFDADLGRASRERVERGSQGLPGWFQRKWPAGRPAPGAEEPPGRTEHAERKAAEISGPGLAYIRSLMIDADEGSGSG